MGGRETKCGPVKGEEEGEPALLLSTEEPLSGVKLLDAPILLLVFFHKALLAELAELRCLAVEASEKGPGGRDLIPDLRGRFEFLKFAYKYHCTAEDEVIFLALDFCIKNVVCTYMLEHKSIDDLLDNISYCLNALMKKEECTSKQFQELVFCFGTIQTAIRQHMLKEERQVFPLLIQQFSSKEQASLIWQFLCSVPIMLLEDFLPWLTSFLSPDEREDVRHCIKEVVPKEKLLQEVVISWLHDKNLSSSVSYIECLKGAQIPDLPASSKDMLKKVYASKSFCGEKWLRKNASCKKTARHTPIYGLHLWHEAIRKDFQDILKDLYQIRSTKNYANLGSVTVQLKFFADVLIFYSTALDKIFNPVLNELANDCLSHFHERFQNESQIEGLRRLLYQKAQNRMPLCNFVEELCGELELFVMGIGKNLALLETEVFPFITVNCTHEFQQWILYTSLRIMPLGLLKCMITWFSAQLSEDDCNSVLSSLKMGGPLANDDTFSFLLYEWVRMGYSGKTSIEKFREDLQEIFKSRTSLLTEHAKEDYAFFSLLLNIQPCNSSNSGALKPHSAQAKGSAYYSSTSDGSTAQKYCTPYSSWINLHIFSPQTLKIVSPFPTFPAENSCSSSILNLEPRPVDHIFFFHKALKKDLEFLVNVSATLAENAGDLVDFCRRFQLVQFLYQIHSDSEDEIAFPALEAKGKAPNISRSYTIDHKLEVELFNKISLILDEISGLCVSVCSIEMDILDQRMLTYRQLCLKLHDMCKSMHQVLCDHIQREEVELWPLFRECFSIEEQEKIIGSMLGRTRAEILQEMIPWLMASLTPEEQQAMMSLWRKTTKNTMFDEWLGEWWEGMKKYDIAKVEEEESNISSCWTADPLKIISKYLPNEGFTDQDQPPRGKGANSLQNNSADSYIDLSGNLNSDKGKVSGGNPNNHQCSDCYGYSGEVDKKRPKELAEIPKQAEKPSQHELVSQDFRHQEQLPIVSQEELEAAIRRISRDSTLDPQKKSYIIQNLLMSRWIITQQKSHSDVFISSNKEVPGRCPSYRDPLKLTFGCKHYKRNCKLVAACCNWLYPCRLCHDDVADHSMDRKATAKMMCMKCLMIQPIGPTCLTVSCNNLSMAKYYCRICKFFDDERDIYHCPFCNLCRVGKGLGIDYFHCMNCNACMSRSLSVHTCREKCLEDNCPICHDYIFTSSAPVKALPCGHLMHSACFQDYTCTHYTCPVCSKSLGDMQVYFAMLDALLAEEKIPDEYSGKTQVILCNDCEKRGTASFHWLYHKCPHCGSYNTRLL